MLTKKELGLLLTVAGFYALLMLAGITCPIRYVTGISCAGCGMTRAWLSLLKGDLSAALAYHPLFWLVIPAGGTLLFRRHLPNHLFRVVMAVSAVLFLGVYALRILSPEDTVVVFAPEEGLVWRLLSHLREWK